MKSDIYCRTLVTRVGSSRLPRHFPLHSLHAMTRRRGPPTVAAIVRHDRKNRSRQHFQPHLTGNTGPDVDREVDVGDAVYSLLLQDRLVNPCALLLGPCRPCPLARRPFFALALPETIAAGLQVELGGDYPSPLGRDRVRRDPQGAGICARAGAQGPAKDRDFDRRDVDHHVGRRHRRRTRGADGAGSARCRRPHHGHRKADKDAAVATPACPYGDFCSRARPRG